MLEREKRSANTWVIAAIVMQIVARFSVLPQEAAWVVALGGAGFWTIGCCHYAAGKGYSASLGFISLVPLLGILILIFLPDQTRRFPRNVEPHAEGVIESEGKLSPLERSVFERIREHVAMLPVTAPSAIVDRGGGELWELPLRPTGEARRVSAEREQAIAHGGEIRTGLFVRVLDAEPELATIEFERTFGGRTMERGKIKIFGDGRAEVMAIEDAD